jgi:hypothetical protein
MTSQSRLSISSSPAFVFVLTMGIVNLFSDMTYEAGGAINGQFMATLGASAAIVSITAGLGEFLGYALRSLGTSQTGLAGTGSSPSSVTASTSLPFPRWLWPEIGRLPPS